MAENSGIEWTEPIMSGVRHPDVCVQLLGRPGNAFYILGATEKALRKAGVSDAEIQEYRQEAESGDYDHLLATTMAWVEVE